MTEHAVRVLIVDDDTLMRAGLHGVLSGDPAIEVVGEASAKRPTDATSCTARAC
jgi:DNA-binding NarL/FixJ family response regulator